MIKKIAYIWIFVLSASFFFAIGQNEDPYSANYINQTLESLENDLKTKSQLIEFYEAKRPEYIKIQSDYRHLLFKKQIKLYEQNFQNIFSLSSTYKDISKFPHDFKTKFLSVIQLDKIIKTTEEDLDRIKSLKKRLTSIDTEYFSDDQKEKHQSAIKICNILISTNTNFINQAKDDCKKFELLENQIDNLKEEADKLKKQIEATIIHQGATPASYIGSWDSFFPSFLQSLRDTYTPDLNKTQRGTELNSLLKAISFGIILSIVLGWFLFGKFFKKILRRRGTRVHKKILIMVGTLLAFSIYLLSLDSFIELDHYRKITVLGPEFILTVMSIIFSLVIRLDYGKFKYGMILYLPMIIMSALLITLRLTTAPNIIVRVLLPVITPVIMFCSIYALYKLKNKLPRLDRILGTTTTIFLILGTILAWSGYSFITFLSLLFWNILMCCILFIVSLFALLKQYQSKFDEDQKKAIPWFVPFFNKLVFPYLAVVMLIFSLYWPMEVFDLGYSFISGLETHNVAGSTLKESSENALAKNITPNSLISIILLGITVNYFLFLTKKWLQEIYADQYEKAGIATLITLGSLVTWIIFSIVALFIIDANFNGIFVILGGMSLGLGLALKDTIENLISGISLMFGRLRQGDIVECDGIRGKVLNLGYRISYIEALDGSIIGFQNTQLFNKNFRNLTQNDNYEKVSIIIGVAYGTDFGEVSEIIRDAIYKVDFLPKTIRPAIHLDEFGDNAIIIKVIVTVPVNQKGIAASKVREEIYNALNENKIVIPFPQREIYVKELPEINSHHNR